MATIRPRLSRCWPRKTSGAPVISSWSLAKATTEPVKVSAPMTTPKLISMRLTQPDVARRADVEGLRRIERGAGDKHRGEPDQAVERRHELRHRGHADAERDHRADQPADDDADADPQVVFDPRLAEGRADGDHHAGDAEDIAAARGRGRRTGL